MLFEIKCGAQGIPFYEGQTHYLARKFSNHFEASSPTTLVLFYLFFKRNKKLRGETKSFGNEKKRNEKIELSLAHDF